jgi:hypothetical protein
MFKKIFLYVDRWVQTFQWCLFPCFCFIKGNFWWLAQVRADPFPWDSDVCMPMFLCRSLLAISIQTNNTLLVSPPPKTQTTDSTN